MVEFKEPSEHKARRSVLNTLEAKINSLGTVQFGSTELQEAEIRVLPMSFKSNGAAAFTPCFFNPYPAELVTSTDDWGNDDIHFPEYGRDVSFPELGRPIDGAQEVINYLTSYLHFCRRSAKDKAHPPPAWCSIDIEKYCFKDLDEVPLMGSQVPQWQAISVVHIPSQEYPHIKCTMECNIDGDDKLLRGELLAIIRIMIGRLNTRSLVDHKITPVLLFSFMGPQHGRILQGHFDGNQVVIHRSKLYDFRHEKDAPLQLFAQWLLCHPSGETKSK